MSAINVNSITGRTGSHGPVLTGVTTISGELHVGSGVSFSGIGTYTNGLNVTSGSVGIGTDNPSSTLQVGLNPNSGNGAGVAAGSNGALKMARTNNADQLIEGYKVGDSTPNFVVTADGSVGVATATLSYRLDIGDGVTDPAAGNQLRVNAAGDYIFALQRQSNASFSIRNNSTSIVHLNTQNSKVLSFGVSSGNTSGSIEDDVRIDSNGHLTIQDGDLVIGTSGHGIDFSATSDGSGTTSSEIFDDYEEGTFTPEFADSGYTYSQQHGRYTKIGNRVCFNLFLTWSANSASGNASVTGLPFAQSANEYQYYGACSITNNGLTLPSGANNFVVQISPNTPQLVIYGQKSGDSKQSMPNSNCGSSGEIIMTGHYLVAQ